MLVNKDSASRLAICSELSNVAISLAKLKKPLVVNSVWGRGSSIGIKNLAIIYAGVFKVNKIGQNFEKLLTTNLWILGLL